MSDPLLEHRFQEGASSETPFFPSWLDDAYLQLI